MNGQTTPPALPPGWKTKWSKTRKAYFYINPQGQGVWDLPANTPSNLPEGWKTLTNNNGRIYYGNTITGSSYYEKPTQEFSNSIRKSFIVGIPVPETCSLRNPDNICYMNSCIQLLYSIDDFRAKILASRSHNPYVQAMRVIFFMMANARADANGHRLMSPPITQLSMELLDQPGRPFSLRALFSTVTIDYDNDRIGHQMDASDFLNTLLEKINTIPDSIAARDDIRAREYSAENAALPNILEKIGNITKSEYNCLHGGRTPDNVDTFEYIAALKKEDNLDWDNDVTLQMLLDTRENNENDPDNWFDGCNPPPGNGGTRGPFRKRTRYLPTSEYLICQITVYTYLQLGNMQLPEGSDPRDIIRDASGNRLRPVILNPTIRINDVTYGLSGYILHDGISLRGGHYVYVKCGDDNRPSVVINDSRIIPAADSEHGTLDMQKRNAYIVLYKRIGDGAAVNPRSIEAIRASTAAAIARGPPARAPARLNLRLNNTLSTLRNLLKVKGVRVYTDAELNAMIGRAVPANWETNTGTVGWPSSKTSVVEGLPVSPRTLADIAAADRRNSRSKPIAKVNTGTTTNETLKSFGLELGGRYKKTRKNKSRKRSSRRHLKKKF